jgi:hypothetical protein
MPKLESNTLEASLPGTGYDAPKKKPNSKGLSSSEKIEEGNKQNRITRLNNNFFIL